MSDDSPLPVTRHRRIHRGVAITRHTARGSGERRASVVLVHGGNESGWVWDRYGDYLAADGWDVHVIDWLHHGSSARLPHAEFLHRSILDVARRELPAVLEDLDRAGPAPIVVGHSMGALATLALATDVPVRAVALLAPACPAQVQADPLPIPVDRTALFPPPPFDVARKMFFSGMSETEAAGFYARLEPESPQAIAETVGYTLSPDLAAVTAPALVLAAELDRLMPPALAEQLAGLLGAEYAVIPGVGHCGLLLAEACWHVGAEKLRDFVRAHG